MRLNKLLPYNIFQKESKTIFHAINITPNSGFDDFFFL